ncbi:MAG: leucine-rich repeat domain-containing protein [Cytophagales bacterium]|nr:MAG: leucine-rich repeat domain-containing protein [Cytophagales bacterium]TAF59260.1 MAG: leucine-rich repeat domain-containing protein [Cytophagales bacterium]
MTLQTLIQEDSNILRRADTKEAERSVALERVMRAVNNLLNKEQVTEADINAIKNLETSINLNPHEYLRLRISAIKFLIEKIAEDDIITESEMYLFKQLTENLSLDSEGTPQVKNEIERIQNMYLIGRSSENSGLTAEAVESPHVRWWKSLTKQWRLLFHRYLNIEGIPTANNIENIFYLAQLDCSFSKITSFAPIQKLENLSILKASGCDAVEDWSILGNFSDLKNLSIKYNEHISDVTWLANLRRLFALDLSETNVSTLDALTPLIQLETLSFGKTHIHDLEPLRGLSKLSSVFCSYTPITSLEPLFKLPQLTHLHVIGCSQLHESAIDAFQRAQPNCKVRHSFEVFVQ